jgi:hypothetical protein
LIIVDTSKNMKEDEEEVVDFSKMMSSPSKWAVVMISGGHFAAAVFQGTNYEPCKNIPT